MIYSAWEDVHRLDAAILNMYYEEDLAALDIGGVSERFLFNTQGSPSWLALTHTDPVPAF